MGYWPGPSEQNRLEDLEARVKNLERFAIAHKRWEDDIFSGNGVWWEQMPQWLKSRYEDVQRLRNEAIKMN